MPRLVESGYQVRLLVRPTSEVSWLPDEHVEVILGDVTNGRDLEDGLVGCKYVVHAAAHFRFWGDEEYWQTKF